MFAMSTKAEPILLQTGRGMGFVEGVDNRIMPGQRWARSSETHPRAASRSICSSLLAAL